MNIPNQDTSIGISNLFLNPYIDEEWDIVIQDGQLVTISGDEYVAQKVQQFLNTDKGEVVTNMEYGIPYLTEILGIKNPDLNIISSLITESILENTTLNNLGVSECTIESITLSPERELMITGLTVTTEQYIIKQDVRV